VRIAIVSPYDLAVPGGVQTHVLSLAAALRRQGDEVEVIGPGPDGAGRRGLGRSSRVPVNGSRAPIALGPGAIVRLRTVLRGSRPDLIHVHEPLVPVVGPAALLSASSPVVVTFHAASEGGALPVLYRAVRGPARAVIARAAAMTAVSRVAADFHAGALGLDPRDIEIIPNGVDAARFVATDRAVRPEPPVRLVFLGRLEHRKGADVALRAFLLLAGERPDLRLRIVGDGPQLGVLRELLATAPPTVRGRVELAGRVSHEDLPSSLHDADVVLLPARGGESFGMVLLEAMAAGAPLVATDIPGYRAVARHDVEALLVAPDDPVALAAATARLLDDRTLRERLRAAGSGRAAAHDWSVVAAATRGVYDRVLGG